MELKENSSAQKLRGSYYTPLELAEIMCRQLNNRQYNQIFEPSCGDGCFIDILSNVFPESKITAVEIEDKEAEKVSRRHQNNQNIEVICRDFFDYYHTNKDKTRFDMIIGNPPYIRYQYLSKEQRDIQSEILTSNNMKSNKLINAWVAFLVACVQMLDENGVISFVIPAEILQVAYAEDLRLFLANNLSNMTIITFKELVFPDIEQEVVVFMGEKGSKKTGIRLIEVYNLTDLKKLNLSKIRFQPISHEKEKWTKYFVNADEMELLSTIRNSSSFTEFSKLGIINVGITTGNNKYFSIDKATEEKYGLSDTVLPLIGRSSHAHGIYFTKKDWQNNIKAKKRAMLVRFPDIPYEEYTDGYKAYIQYGEKNEENTGYKCSIRDRWYIVPSVWIPDAFFLRRNNLYPKFVINKCGAVSTDTMHRMKFNEGVDSDLVLLSYYNSISFAFTEVCGRSYGGGVLEILPGEMGKIMLPIIKDIPVELKKKLLDYIDDVVRNDKNIEDALDYVDQKLLVETLNISSKWCSSCRDIWKKLQTRRLTRGE